MSERIALFSASLRGGGAERVMLNLARGFADRGFTVDLVLAQAEGPYLNEVPSGVTVVDLGAHRVLASLPPLIGYLRRKRPKAMLSAMGHVNLVALWAARLARVKTRLVVSIHNDSAAQDTRTIRSLTGRALIRRFYPRADMVVAVSQGVREHVLRSTGMSPERVRVIHNPVVTPELYEKAKLPAQHPWFARGEPPVILGAGRLCKQKDFPSLVRAFALVRKQQSARLVILGEGPERHELEVLINELGLEENVALLGFVDNPYAYMARASVFVLSSAWEGFGNVLVEAMAVGCPLVSIDCGSGPAEVLDNGRYGHLVPVGSVDDLASSIVMTLNAATDADMLHRRASVFDVKNISAQYLEVMLGDPLCTVKTE